jgi:large subunit ribosomal protein L21
LRAKWRGEIRADCFYAVYRAGHAGAAFLAETGTRQRLTRSRKRGKRAMPAAKSGPAMRRASEGKEMFAVIKTGGKQYRVAANDLLDVEKVAGEPGDIVEYGDVLAVGEGKDAQFGAPLVSGALVTAEIVEQFRTRKVISFKKRRRQNSKRTKGHRQMLTTVRISEILTGGAKPSKKVAAKAAPAAEPVATPAAGAPAAEAAAAAPKKEKAPKAEKSTATAANATDDVALIGGVGPALKKKLEGAGITSLKQLAEISADAMEKLDADLKLGGRTAREEWGEQARELLAGKPPRAKIDREKE